MICVRGIRIPLKGHRRLDGNLAHELPLATERALALLRLDEGQTRRTTILRRSIDARKPRGPGRAADPNVVIEFTCGVELKDPRAERAVVNRLGNPRVALAAPDAFAWPERAARPLPHRPVVVGAGCAGLFCALALAHAGLAPLLVEQGDDCARRTAAVRAFAQGGPLDPLSNVQFGLGGAGTFSDGKLSTGTRDASHRLILEALHAAGAPERILVDSHPHVGSDLLPGIVERLVAAIGELGGEVRVRTRMTGLGLERGRVASVELERDGTSEAIAASTVILATGHSARDVFELLAGLSVPLEQKPFAVGVRVEHLQATVDADRYGRWAGHPALGAASYRAAWKASGGRRCFTFCMCPGGQVMAAASEPHGVVTNGASETARDGANANAALLVNVLPEDLDSPDPLAGIAWQRRLERAAYEAGGGDFAAPAQLVGDFLRGTPSTGPGSVRPTYPRGVSWGAIDGLFPAYVTDTLREALGALPRTLPFFGEDDAVLTAPESRSSSPVRIPRTDALMHPNVAGLYPVGEGAGWAGGIMSAAADGIRAARAIVASLG